MFQQLTVTSRQGKDPGLTESKTGTAIARGSVPLEHGWGDSKEVTWCNWVAFGKSAETLAKYSTKGAIVTLSGPIKLSIWEKDDGDVTTLEMTVDKFSLISRPDSDQPKVAEPAADEVPF